MSGWPILHHLVLENDQLLSLQTSLSFIPEKVSLVRAYDVISYVKFLFHFGVHLFRVTSYPCGIVLLFLYPLFSCFNVFAFLL